MRRLYLLGAFLAVAACAPQPSPPAASAPPPPPPVAAAPPAPPMMASLDGEYAGPMKLEASGQSQTYLNRTGCTEHRKARMTVQNGNISLRYANWKGHRLHYRGKVDPSGAVILYHTNEDGSMSQLTGQIQNNGFVGDMLRGPCQYKVTLARR